MLGGVDAVSAEACRRARASLALQQEGKGKHPGGAGEMHFSAYAGRSPPHPQMACIGNPLLQRAWAPFKFSWESFFSSPLPALQPSTSPLLAPSPAPAPLGSRESCRWVGGWVDGRTLWPPSGSVRHPCKSLETTSWDWKLRLLLQGTKKRTKNKRMPKSHEARGYKSKLTAAQHLLLFGRLHDA